MLEKPVTNKINTRPLRSTSIELLRIISMVMIVFHHFAIHGGFQWDSLLLSVPYFWCNFISMGGKIGVDVFVLISGYFLVTDEGPIFNFKKILKYWGQVFFYSIVIYIIFVLLDSQIFSLYFFCVVCRFMI